MSSAKWRPFCLDLNVLITLRHCPEHFDLSPNAMNVPQINTLCTYFTGNIKIYLYFYLHTEMVQVIAFFHRRQHCNQNAILTTFFSLVAQILFLWQLPVQAVTRISSKWRYFRSNEGFKYSTQSHDDVIKWEYFPRYWPFVRGIHRSPVSSPHKGQWRRALMVSLICAWISGWVNNRKAGDLRCHRAHYDVTVMSIATAGDLATHVGYQENQ